jgi:hypothetical protein
MGRVAARTDIDSLERVLRGADPALVFSATTRTLRGRPSAEDWLAAQTTSDNNLYSLPLWQDGDWAVVVDDDFLINTSEPALEALSLAFGHVLGVFLDESGESIEFVSYRQGAIERHINQGDGELLVQGEPLANEAGIPFDSLYHGGAERLWRSFGLSGFAAAWSQPLRVLAVEEASRSGRGAAAARPWWKLW